MKFAKLAMVAVIALGTLSPTALQAGVQTSSVKAFTTDVYRIWCNQGFHSIAVRGDGDTDLDLYVHGASGLIASDDDSTDNCLVQFHVSRPGYFVVKITNRGAVHNNYVMVTD
jgi:hypothetical protein